MQSLPTGIRRCARRLSRKQPRTASTCGAGVVCAVLLLWGSGSPRSQEDQGRQVFARAGCESCHGAGAKGGDAPPLAGLKRPYPEFVNIVREGLGEMPPNSKDDVSDDELSVIYRWLVQLPPKHDDDVIRKQARQIAHRGRLK